VYGHLVFTKRTGNLAKGAMMVASRECLNFRDVLRELKHSDCYRKFKNATLNYVF
jgi:hypothetical protein